jgi:site-specific DNA-methyltransferase (cytosine-N4-specific)
MTWQILQADAHHIPLADKSVQCVVTSPPYWGLRDYGTATWVGGDEGCDHKTGNQVKQTRAPYECNTGQRPGIDASMCKICGATRIDSQIGLEATPEAYVEKIVAVFAEVWRVLRDDGVIFVNLGDSYNAHPGQRTVHDKAGYKQQTNRGSCEAASRNSPELKAKDLVGIPWMVAFALRADGWYLRSDIIWSKPNPMPESVTDRPTKAHEYIFMLTKSERYYFDQDAVREAITCERLRGSGPMTNPLNGDRNDSSERGDYRLRKVRSPAGWKTGNGSHGSIHENGREQEITYNEVPAGRNIRTVWEIATQPYPEAHFATFPEEIAKRCIKAGTSEKGACQECGAPWERVTEKTVNTMGMGRNNIAGSNIHHGWEDTPRATINVQTLGWQPTCKHDAPTVPCIVLDPFSGAGTVPLVADKLNRRGIGLELKADYCRMANNRCYDDAPLFASG